MAIILFDFDGVLADTLEDMLNFAREACAQMGFPRNPTPADLDALETNVLCRLWAATRDCLHNISMNLSVAACKCSIKEPLPPEIFDGMEQVVPEAAKHNTIAIVTGNTTPTVEAFLIEYDLQKHVQLVIGVEQKGSRPEKIKRALEELAANADIRLYDRRRGQ